MFPCKVTLDKAFKEPGLTSDKERPVQFSIRLPKLSAVKIWKLLIGLRVGGFRKFDNVISIIFPAVKLPENPLNAFVIVTLSDVVPNVAVHVGLMEPYYKLERHPVS